MGRTVLHGRGDRAAGPRRQAEPPTTSWFGARGRGGGGRDPSGVSRLATLIRILAAGLGIGLVLATAVVVYGLLGDLPSAVRGVVATVDGPAGDDRARQAFQVRQGQSAAEIGDELYARGLIRSSILFRALVEARGVGAQIESGEYQLSPAMTTNEVVSVLSRGAGRGGVTLTIPEGWRAEQAAQRIEELGLGPAAAFMALVRAGSAAPVASDGGSSRLPIADDIPAGQSLEGYLFPDTYQVPRDADPRGVVDLMVRQFDRQLAPQIRQQAAAQGLTVHQAITLASIVEREAVRPDEQPTIAGVYLNRLEANMPLQADPTVQFAVASANPAEAIGFNFWKRDLTRQDLQIASPYNTYARRGLPPGPICSPGIDAIRAAANPTRTEYFYFVARGDGSHAFARTEPEHRDNVERYQRGS